MKLYSLYFSPTGGTKKVSDIICSAWNCEKIEIDLSDKSISLNNIKLEKDDVCIISVPSFSGRVPQFIIPKLQKLQGSKTKAVIVTAFGNREFDDTLFELQNTLEPQGFVCVCAVAAVTQHSLMPKYGAGRPDADDIKELKAFSVKCKNAVDTASNSVKVPGNYPYRKYNAIPIKPKVKRTCKGCKLCVDRCPVQAISADNPTKTDTEKCISCLQCITVCPHNARYTSRLMRMMATKKMKKVCSGRKENRIFLAD